MLRSMLFAVAASVGVGSCAGVVANTHESSVRPRCGFTVVVVVSERATLACDMVRGQRLDVAMYKGGTMPAMRGRCDRMGGGDLVFTMPYGMVCEGVDF